MFFIIGTIFFIIASVALSRIAVFDVTKIHENAVLACGSEDNIQWIQYSQFMIGVGCYNAASKE